MHRFMCSIIPYQISKLRMAIVPMSSNATEEHAVKPSVATLIPETAIQHPI